MSEETISGECPICAMNSHFRKLSFTENLGTLGGFLGGALLGGVSKKKESVSTLVNEATDTRSFPNYICEKCDAKVMQCSCCKLIIPYEHDGTSHQCSKNKKKTTASSPDLISQLERLVVLKEKGALTEAEFEVQKQNLLQS